MEGNGSLDGLMLKVIAAPEQKLVYKNYVTLSPEDFSKLVDLKKAMVKERMEKEKEKDAMMMMNLSDSEIQTHGLLVSVGQQVFTAFPHNLVQNATIGMNALQRRFLASVLDKAWRVVPFLPPQPQDNFFLSSLTWEVQTLRQTGDGKPPTIDCKQLSEELKSTFAKQVFTTGQEIAHVYQGKVAVPLKLTVREVKHTVLNEEGGEGEGGGGGGEDEESQQQQRPKSSKSSSTFASSLASSLSSKRGLLLNNTDLVFNRGETGSVVLKGQDTMRSASKILEVDFEKLGIGGLDKEFSQIFRRAFASRILPPDVVANMGLNHVRGMLLYGPPGCGKTLIARQISKVLQGGDPESKREPKIVNGPEILSKYVGESEKNIRELFQEAEAEQATAGDESELHVIIFDEIDAIAKTRGTSRDGTGVSDSLVNQLLSKIDGVDALNNILLIGMTNRLDMLDSALLRPGRFEVQIEIGLPEEKGRIQILNIHTQRMRHSGHLANDVDIPTLAAAMKNFTGAEIEGVVRNAASFAFARQLDTKTLTKIENPESIQITKVDFENAMAEAKPAFGVSDNEELQQLYAAGIIDFSERFRHVSSTLTDLAMQVQNSSKAQLSIVSVLLAGPAGSGKTALAARLAYESEFPFVRIVSPDSMIGMSEQGKCNQISTVFDEAYKSPLSMILLEDVERLIELTRVGPRFSNQVLQTLLILVKKPPPKGRRLLVVAMTSAADVLHELDFLTVFNVVLNTPQLESADEVREVVRQMCEGGTMPSAEELDKIADGCTTPISIKKLLLVIEMAKRDEEGSPLRYLDFIEALHNAG